MLRKNHPLRALAVYDRASQALLGVIRIRVLCDREDGTLYLWESASGFHGNPLVYPERSKDTPPPFMADFIRNHKDAPTTILDFLLKHHSAAQTALCFLPTLGNPAAKLDLQVKRLLRKRDLRIPGRTLAIVHKTLTPLQRKLALCQMEASRNSVVAHAIALDRRRNEKARVFAKAS